MIQLSNTAFATRTVHGSISYSSCEIYSISDWELGDVPIGNMKLSF